MVRVWVGLARCFSLTRCWHWAKKNGSASGWVAVRLHNCKVGDIIGVVTRRRAGMTRRWQMPLMRISERTWNRVEQLVWNAKTADEKVRLVLDMAEGFAEMWGPGTSAPEEDM